MRTPTAGRWTASARRLATAVGLAVGGCTPQAPPVERAPVPVARSAATAEGDALAGPHPGLKGPLAPLRFWMTATQAHATKVPLSEAPGLVAAGVAYLPTWAPCGDEPRLSEVRVDVPDPEGTLRARLERAWGKPRIDDDAVCWFDDAEGVRACIGRGLPFGRKGHTTVQLSPFVTAGRLVSGRASELLLARGPVVGQPAEEVIDRFADACVGRLWHDDPNHPRISLPPTRDGSESMLVLEVEDDRVARAMLVALVGEGEVDEVVAGVQTRFGPGTPGTLDEPSGHKQTLQWLDTPDVRLVTAPGLVRLLLGPWGERWSIEPPGARGL